MPYDKYSGMAQEDLKALVAYLRTLKPVKKATPELKTCGALCAQLGHRGLAKSLWDVSRFTGRRRPRAASSGANI